VNVYFDVQEMYCLPQYTPINECLGTQGIQVTFVIYRKGVDELRQKALVDNACDGSRLEWVNNEAEGRALYLNELVWT